MKRTLLLPLLALAAGVFAQDPATDTDEQREEDAVRNVVWSCSSRDDVHSPTNAAEALFHDVVAALSIPSFDVFGFDDGTVDFFAVKTDSALTDAKPLESLRGIKFNNLSFEFYPEASPSVVAALCSMPASDGFGLRRFPVGLSICSIPAPRVPRSRGRWIEETPLRRLFDAIDRLRSPPRTAPSPDRPGLDTEQCATNRIPGECFAGLSAPTVELTGLTIVDLDSFASSGRHCVDLVNCNVESMPSFSGVEQLTVSRMSFRDLQWLVETKAGWVYVRDSTVETALPDEFPGIGTIIFQNVATPAGLVELREIENPASALAPIPPPSAATAEETHAEGAETKPHAESAKGAE